MIYSMTAFGRTENEQAGYRVTMEIRTLNSRFLDVIPRFPKNFLEFEDAARKQVSATIRRGRVEVFVQIENLNLEQKTPDINPLLARFYWGRLQELHRNLPGTEPPRLENLLAIPYLFETREVAVDRETVGKLLMETLAETLRKVQAMRAQEGEALLRDFMERLAMLRREVDLIADRKDLFLPEYRQRLHERLQELLNGTQQVDEARLAQELVFFAERSDITEEIVRFRSHLDQLESLTGGKDPAEGRTLDFLTQELHREVNTMGCKSSDMEILQAVVRMKSEIGKLKEQVQNFE